MTKSIALTLNDAELMLLRRALAGYADTLARTADEVGPDASMEAFVTGVMAERREVDALRERVGR